MSHESFTLRTQTQVKDSNRYKSTPSSDFGLEQEQQNKEIAGTKLSSKQYQFAPKLPTISPDFKDLIKKFP